MKKMTLALVFAVLAFCGCASHYVMKLSNGARVTTASRPKLVKGFYVYKDAKGEKVAISQARVMEIEPASFAAEEKEQADKAKLKTAKSK